MRFTFTLPGSYRAEKKEWQKEIILPEATAFRVISHSEMGKWEIRGFMDFVSLIL